MVLDCMIPDLCTITYFAAIIVCRDFVFGPSCGVVLVSFLVKQLSF